MASEPNKPHGLSSLWGFPLGFIPGVLTKEQTWFVIILGFIGIAIIYVALWICYLVRQYLYMKNKITSLENEINSQKDDITSLEDDVQKVTKNRDSLISNRKKLLAEKDELLRKVNVQGKIIEYVIYRNDAKLVQAANVEQLEELSDVTKFQNREDY
ncbi:hypothetical protein WECO103172_03920 [Weissella confusa]|uniref:hypothetical protein n=2 Tax=Weissella confusa TaxID=1583 RepID=UPI000705303A|nr:hypothetical protein [Weissella confusa]MBJ7698584.1 hypothetical protein [Weissella confusa]MBS7550818.1 hypothetical protein [Weissella confusa]TGE74541.1 hypothetical protein C6P09_02345 [Weissella confusa]GEO56835.1 hypothetical protein WCO01_20370 [Weissella confusa]